MHVVCAYRGVPNDVGVFACILNEAWDGKYRQIDVKINRPGVKVSFRHGYYAREKPPVFNLAEMLSYGRITSAATGMSDVRDVPFNAYASLDNLGPVQVQVDVNIKPQNIGLALVNGRHAGQLRVTIYYADGSGRYLGEEPKKMGVQVPYLQGKGIKCSICYLWSNYSD